MRSFIKNILTSSLFILFYTIGFAQQYTQTVTAQNRNCNSTCSVLDIPALAGNNVAIIMITPVSVNGVNSNPHPIGAYYMYLNQWSVFNLDAAAMPVGAKFNVEYYLNTDSTHFVYVVPQKVNTNDISYIDRTGLNNHPNAQLRVFPHVSSMPGSVGNTWNKEDVKVQYDATAGKWFIANVNGTPVPSASAYNVVFSNGSIVNPNGENQTGTCNCVIPTSLPPNGPAGGDLSGAYPNPTIRSLQGNALSNVQPTLGQVLKWDGNEWIPSNSNGSNGTASSNKPSVLVFNEGASVALENPNINTATLPGLDNKSFTLGQSSRVVFSTVISVMNFHPILTEMEVKPVEVWLTVKILNSTNQVVGLSVSEATIQFNRIPTVVSAGAGILPAGTYHTSVSIGREEGGYAIKVMGGDWPGGERLSQGGQMIVEIFPD